MKNKILSLFALALIGVSFNVGAAYPTPEGIFRFGPKVNYIDDLVLLDVVIHKMKSAEDQVSGDYVSSSLGSRSEKKQEQRFLQFIFAPKERRVELLQVEFSSGDFEERNAIESRYMTNLLGQLRSDQQTTRTFFYSLIGMYSLNSSEFISDLLSRSVPGYKLNRELMNREKMALMNRYKRYLQERREERDGEEGKEELISPLSPEDPEKRQHVNTIMASPMYERDKNISLVRENRNFFWELSYDNFNAKFTSDDQYLRSAYLRMAEAPIRLNISQYVLVGGRKELPESMIYETPRGDVFRIDLVNFRRVTNRGDRLSQMAANYQKIIEERRSEETRTEEKRKRRFEFLY